MQRRRPAFARRRYHVVRYGRHAAQFGVLRMPTATAGDRRHPVVVLLHGGFWRSRWQLDLMDALAVDLAERGLASWNVEYRPPDRHGWTATTNDVRAAIDHINDLAGQFPLNSARMALIGHSASGQLAVQAAADTRRRPVRPSLVVPLAGLVDLIEAHRRDLGNGAVASALGGTPDEIPAVYAQALPLLRVPIGVRQLVVIGCSDSPDLREMSRRYVTTASCSGDDVELLEDDPSAGPRRRSTTSSAVGDEEPQCGPVRPSPSQLRDLPPDAYPAQATEQEDSQTTAPGMGPRQSDHEHCQPADPARY